MIQDLTIGQYIPGNSIIHKLDPRSKLILTAALIVLMFFLNSFIDYVAIVVTSVLAIIFSDIPARYFFKGIRPVLFIILFTGIVNIFFMGNGTAVHLWIFSISIEGVVRSLQIVVRLIAIIIAANILITTTPPLMLTIGIDRLLMPLQKIGVPIQDFSMTLTIALRFVPVLLEETQKIMKAQAARGADFNTGNIIQRAKSFVPVLIPLFVSAFRRADELAVAMESRCYVSGKLRTSMRVLRFGIEDIYAALYMAVLIVVVAFL